MRGELPEIACPVLLTASLRAIPPYRNVAGQVCPVMWPRQIPDCQVFFTNAGGHPLMWSQPEAFQSNSLDISAHVERAVAGSAAGREHS